MLFWRMLAGVVGGVILAVGLMSLAVHLAGPFAIGFVLPIALVVTAFIGACLFWNNQEV